MEKDKAIIATATVCHLLSPLRYHHCTFIFSLYFLKEEKKRKKKSVIEKKLVIKRINSEKFIMTAIIYVPKSLY